MNKKIVISGASGFVGKNLSKYFVENNVLTQELSLRNKNWRLDFDKNVNAIIHLAGKAHDTSNTSDELEYFKVNRDLTIDLFDEFLNSDVQCFIYFSSVKAIADFANDVIDEKIIADPRTAYGRSKLEAENYLLSKQLPEGKRLFIVRPCMIHGPGNKGNLNLLYKIVEKGIPWPLSKFHNERSFLSIDNLSFLIFKMINNDKLESGVYNFADDEALSTNELINIINEALNKKSRFLPINKNFIERIARVGDRIHLPLNSERLKKLTENYVVSNQKIKLALGIDKLPLTAAEGLVKTIKSFKNK